MTVTPWRGAPKTWDMLKSLSRDLVCRRMFGWARRVGMLLWLARLGYGARGVVYLLVGGLAIRAGLADTRPPGARRMLAILSESPAGVLVVGALAVGLFMYAAWRSIQALMDLNEDGTGRSGLIRRGGMLLSAISHALLGKAAFEAVEDWGEAMSGQPVRHAEAWAHMVLAWPVGRWLVAAIGVAAMVVGLFQFVKAKGSLLRNVDVRGVGAILIRLLGIAGLVSRGVIFAGVGASFLLAAWRTEADPAGGLQAVLLHVLWQVPFGEWIYFSIAAGLVMFGVFNLLKSWFHQFPNP